MGNKKKKYRGYTEERNKTEDKELKKKNESNQSGSLKLFILVGLGVVVVPVIVAVVYSNEDYQQYISDVLKNGKELWDSVNKRKIERKDEIINGNENNKEKFVSDQNKLYEETNRHVDSQNPSSRESASQGMSHTKQNINDERSTQNIKTSKTEQNQTDDVKHQENKSKLARDLKSDCESKDGTTSELCSERDNSEKVQSGSKSDTTSVEQETGSQTETASFEQARSSKTETLKTKKESDSELKSTVKEIPYEKIAITNHRDFQFREELDEADMLLDKDNLEEALRGYDKVLAKYPESPRAIYGKAETLDKTAEKQRSNSLLEEAIATFQKVLDTEDVPGELAIKAGTRMADRQQFRGWGGKAVKTLKILCKRFPDNVDLKKKLGVGYLIIGQIEKSKQIFRELYEKGAQKGLFLSAYQRSLYNVDHLTGRPWWKPDQTGYKTYLKDNWRVIKEEGMKIKENCAKAPRTCELIDKIPDAKGLMHPGVHVWPHCGPTNCRIRAHLGLVVPKGPRIRVGNTTRQWSVGKFIIFDDSFEHEVWHNGTELRLVLIVDFWHPELSALEKRDLTPI
ncbi:hypothetical protein KUTeg_000758 [Tegillarca granosa]|uniref:Aspartyl/asparaginy/proline hydroxylase domain-containing protein n=1 Tax=Tegillarca granosa TaxID=220873 RepID=A0ABQ9G1V0_TEGGR|nr:hypothetical protein KUTeg_000758 [Tegillarca granosa]